MRAFLFALLVMLAGAARAEEVVTSPGPQGVSVTIYRAPDRGADTPVDRRYPQGYALISETRTVAIPAGAATIRFEGVASGILAESAIVSGLPDGVREKNLDADLLSPRSLFDRALGRRVIVRRTDPGTGRVRDVQATIRSSKDGGMVLTTPEGVEAIHCAGLPEQIVYASVPPGLAAKPTLSIATDSPVARTVTLTLSYLAGGFDWQVNYVATMRPEGRSADLVAWLTLVSDDVTSFVEAGTSVVAGKVNRDGSIRTAIVGQGGAKDYRCWTTAAPMGRDVPPPAPPPPAPPAMAAPMAADIIVTGARIARHEELGDLKLYRVPQPVTVAAQAQKQVALFVKPAVPVRAVYVSQANDTEILEPRLKLRANNRTNAGLGLALPAGRVAVFQPAAGRDILVGEASTDDKAVGEEVELTLDPGPAVQVVATVESPRPPSAHDARRPVTVAATVTNANPWPVAYEVEFQQDPLAPMDVAGIRTVARNGKRVWATTVPANGSVRITYRISHR